MVYNSETNNLDIYSDGRFWCGIANTDTTTYPLSDFTRGANFGLDRVTMLILKADGKWQHDDTVQTTELLDVSTALVSGTKKYAIPVTWLKISMVRIKDSGGNWKILNNQKDRKQWSDSQLTASSGEPKEYDLLGNWLYLDKPPNYASTGGLEVTYQRGPSYFITTDTTKTPGFASHFHRLIPLYCALDYCEVNDLAKRSAAIRLKIDKLEQELVIHYSDRNVDEGLSITVQSEDYGQSSLGGSVSTNPDGFF